MTPSQLLTTPIVKRSSDDASASEPTGIGAGDSLLATIVHPSPFAAGGADDTTVIAGPPAMWCDDAPSPAQVSQLTRGAEIGRYLVLGCLGEGGMGVVYEAYDPTLHRQVAIKLVRPVSHRSRARRRARLLREAQALARVSHPNVITVYDIGVYDEQVFIAMELVDGVTLTDWLHERERSPEQIVEVFAAAARGLVAAHAVGLVHRDFKLSNVMIGVDGRVRVLDFGLVCARDPAPTPGSPGVREPDSSMPALTEGHNPQLLDSPLTVVGSVVGTPSYMAPEQHLGYAVDERTDQFGFCVALYKALYGQRPFAGEESGELRASVLAGAVLPPPSGTRVPARFASILVRGLATNPADRYPSMEALLADLQRAPRGRRTTTRKLVAAAVVGVVAAFVLALAVPSRAGVPESAGDDAAALAPSDPNACRPRRPGSAQSGLTGLAGSAAFGIAEAEALARAGQLDAALPRARESARDAGESGDTAAEAEALGLVGRLERRVRNLDSAEASLYLAAERAANAGDDRLVAASMVEQLRVLAEQPDRWSDALVVARIAPIAVARAAAACPDSALEVDLLRATAALDLAVGKPGDARPRLARALELAERDHAGDPWLAAGIHVQLGKAALDESNAADALEHLDLALAPEGEQSLPAYPLRRDALHYRAAALFALGRCDQATSSIEHARVIEAREAGTEHPDAIASDLLAGRILAACGQPAQALAMLEGARGRAAGALGTRDALYTEIVSISGEIRQRIESPPPAE